MTSKWSEYDKYAFTIFPEANDLAEALFESSARGRDAVAAIKSIRHTAQNQVDWFYNRGSFLQVRPPVWIIRQEKFEEDFYQFLDKAGLHHLKNRIEIETDPVRAHVGSYSESPKLTEKAIDNLRCWYCQDICFYDMCENWLSSQL
ncbi:hypothetical protein HMH01_17255 [Halovulum dunhuangense]|uniref:Uncharacterized protein n=1 Tax=Halovulum dunhuangense TaxID=1505036 RepID=A0A849L6N2_9RHOB|nr:hypothetical protein [Halovulum dunhuangense]NNU82188.1 hypothetical protein [Halovulum dunhuangense]